MHLSIIIPCCNEEGSIPQLVTRLLPVVEELRRNRSVEVVFVDDGSTDTTYHKLQEIIAAQREMRIVQHPVNRGLGAALHTGFANAGGELIVTAGSDGTYGFDEIPALLSYLRPGIDIVTASPPALFRAYRREVVRRVPFYSTGFLAGAELMVNAMLMGYHVAEYPTGLHARQAGASKAKIFRIIRAHLRFQCGVLLRRLKLAPLPQPLEQEKAA